MLHPSFRNPGCSPIKACSALHAPLSFDAPHAPPLKARNKTPNTLDTADSLLDTDGVQAKSLTWTASVSDLPLGVRGVVLECLRESGREREREREKQSASDRK